MIGISGSNSSWIWTLYIFHFFLKILSSQYQHTWWTASFLSYNWREWRESTTSCCCCCDSCHHHLIAHLSRLSLSFCISLSRIYFAMLRVLRGNKFVVISHCRPVSTQIKRAATASYSPSLNSPKLELVRSYRVFRICSIDPLVRNAESLYKQSKKLF